MAAGDEEQASKTAPAEMATAGKRTEVLDRWRSGGQGGMGTRLRAQRKAYSPPLLDNIMDNGTPLDGFGMDDNTTAVTPVRPFHQPAFELSPELSHGRVDYGSVPSPECAAKAAVRGAAMRAGLEGYGRCSRPARWVCGVCAISSCFDHTSYDFLSCMCTLREDDVAPVAAAAAAEAAERARRAASAATATVWAAGPAAVGLQRLFRGHRVRQRERQIEASWFGHCAVRLQSLFRGHRVRCAVADWCQQRALWWSSGGTSWYQQRALISLHDYIMRVAPEAASSSSKGAAGGDSPARGPPPLPAPPVPPDPPQEELRQRELRRQAAAMQFHLDNIISNDALERTWHRGWLLEHYSLNSVREPITTRLDLNSAAPQRYLQRLRHSAFYQAHTRAASPPAAAAAAAAPTAPPAANPAAYSRHLEAWGP